MSISDAPAGTAFKILGVRFGREVGRRLSDMGFAEGTEGLVIRAGFLRGPMQVRIMGYDVLLRRSEAACVEIERSGSGE